MHTKILAIGLQLAAEDVEEVDLDSKVSLLDWDIILFRPTITPLISSDGDYCGKPALSDNSSFTIKEACEHWRREVKEAVESGKTVLVFLPAVEQVYIATGQREYSGTGRNRHTTRMVAPYTNYKALPISSEPLNAQGTSMKLASSGTEVLRSFWNEFGSELVYKVILPADTPGVCLTTKAANKPVGAIARSKMSGGALLLLPDMDFEQEKFLEWVNEEALWTPTARQFAARLVTGVIALHTTLHSSLEFTPEPLWAKNLAYELAAERSLNAELLIVERELEKAQRRKESLLDRLRAAGRLRALLYEKGKPLESAIIAGLQLLGFRASPYKDGDSEFDVVFQCEEGRLLGEAEGKDTKAINVDKLRQLAMNIHEDLAREEVTSSAKGVLFGNGYRNSPPNERGPQFTEKCISAAESSSTALVATCELYRAAQYLSDHEDEEYANTCRTAILTGVGNVTLPQPPEIDIETITNTERAESQ